MFFFLLHFGEEFKDKTLFSHSGGGILPFLIEKIAQIMVEDLVSLVVCNRLDEHMEESTFFFFDQ